MLGVELEGLIFRTGWEKPTRNYKFIRDFQEINYPNKRTTEAQRTQREVNNSKFKMTLDDSLTLR
jgi:hypothetical protein